MNRAGPARTLLRGATRRCGRCGGRRIFDGWFRLRERCPTCGYRFAREEGFMTGVYLVNFGATVFLLWLGMMAYIVWRAATSSDAALWPVLVGLLVVAVVVPVVGYPFAASTWAALDLLLRPLEPDEEADAATWVAAQDR